MYEAGYKNITNIDISSVVVEQMQEKYADRYPELKCKELNNI
jgi:hypothetical protein